MGELRRQQASAELLRRQPRLRGPRRPAGRPGLHGPRPQRLPQRLRARRRRRRHPEHGRGRLEGPRADHQVPAAGRHQLLRLRPLHAVLHRAAEKQSKDPEPLCQGINQVPFYCVDSAEEGPIDVQKVDTLDWLSADSDGDGIRDDARRRRPRRRPEHHRVPGRDRRSVQATASTASSTRACPNADSRFCLIGSTRRRPRRDPQPRRQRRRRRRPARHARAAATSSTRCAPTPTATASPTASSTGRRSTSTAPRAPYPGKAPYPNPLDGTDADLDFDGDGLTLDEEYKAWNYSGRPPPLNYSDGAKYTGGRVAAPVGRTSTTTAGCPTARRTSTTTA